MKSKIEITLYSYIKALDSAETTGPKQEGEESIEVPIEQEIVLVTEPQPLVMTGQEDGLFSGKIIKGDITLCKDEMRDLLDAERDGKSALFILKLVD